MKNFLKKLNKKHLTRFVSTATFSLLTLMLVNVANSSSCYFLHQPKEPSAIEDYKWIK